MSKHNWQGPTQVVVGSVVAGLVAAADCRHENALWTALLDQSTGEIL